MSKDKIENDFHIINPKLISEKDREKILNLFEKIEERKILSLERELEQHDRLNFDEAVLNAIGCIRYKEQIKNSLLTLYKIRANVKS